MDRIAVKTRADAVCSEQNRDFTSRKPSPSINGRVLYQTHHFANRLGLQVIEIAHLG